MLPRMLQWNHSDMNNSEKATLCLLVASLVVAGLLQSSRMRDDHQRGHTYLVFRCLFIRINFGSHCLEMYFFLRRHLWILGHRENRFCRPSQFLERLFITEVYSELRYSRLKSHTTPPFQETSKSQRLILSRSKRCLGNTF